MIEIDTELMKQLAQTAENAYTELQLAEDCLNKVTVHNDWNCSERDEINAAISENRKRMKRLREEGEAFDRSITSVCNDFETLERSIPDSFSLIDDMVGSIISIPVIDTPMLGKGVMQEISRFARHWSRGDLIMRNINGIESAIKVIDFQSLDFGRKE